MNDEQQNRINLIKKFVKPEAIVWGREIKLAKDLLNDYDYIDYVSIPFKLNSLAWFKTTNGQKELNKQKQSIEVVKTYGEN